ncbi:MAG: OmpA family protein [Flavobacteriaceae bacterium]|nr:OmpA family protein [Flavobacteriaceae bacterium]
MKNKLLSLIFFVILISCLNINASEIVIIKNKATDPIQIFRNKDKLMLYSKNKIKFSLNSSKLNESTIYELSIIAASLIQNPRLKVKINVHNDSRSDVDFSKMITQERANTIKEFLVNYGVNTKNLIAIGHGDKFILNRCGNFVKCTDKEHSINKRVELEILNPEALYNYTFFILKEHV